MATDISKNYINLCNSITDLEDHIRNNEIKVIPLPKNSKAPIIPEWNTREYSLTESFTYQTKKGKEVTQVGLQYHTGNYGILIGYNNQQLGYSIAVIDIDGYTLNTDDKDEKAQIKKETQKLIYEALKDIPNSLQVKTQSGGYHIYLWTKKTIKSTSVTSHSLYFPENFKIPELAGKCLDNSIEIFTNEERKQTVLPSSTIYNKATKEIREYRVISTVNKFSDIDITDDINQLVIDTLTSKGYTYRKPSTENHSTQPKRKLGKKSSSNNTGNLRKLGKDDIKTVVQLVTPIFKETEGAKHTTALYLGGYFSYHITKASAGKICNGIVKEIGNIFNDSQAFKTTVLQNYDKKETDKAGLPKLCNHILSHNSTFNVSKFSDKLNQICNQSFKKELVGDLFINENQVPIYLYEDEYNKWLRYPELFTGIDMELNPTKLLGTFKDSKTDKEIITFKFKYTNKFFEIPKKEIESINYFLGNVVKDLKLPKFFTETIRVSLNILVPYATNPKELSKAVELKELFKTRNRESYARKELGNYLHEKGTILRRGLNTPYIVNKNNGYDSVKTDDIIDFLYKTGDFEINTIHTDDITKALGFISERVTPEYNIVKFQNCLYDMENFTVIDNPEKPILTLTEVQHNYNPQAKGKLIVEFLETSLKQADDDDEKVQERVQGFYEMIGYLLTSGNPLNAWFILTGKAGAGKGTTANIITNIFGNDKIGHLQLQELTPNNNFATSHLVSKQVNIITDSPTKPIEDKGLLKSITGYDDIQIEFKGKDKETLPKEEVPDMVTVCNNIPRFKDGFDDTIVQRAIIFHYPNQFRGTDSQNKTLLKDILNTPQEMEYLLFQGITAYKDMVINGRDFKARISEAKTMELLGKHTDPIAYILQKVIKYNENSEKDGEEPIIRDELNKLIVFIANKEGINLPNLKNNLIKPQTLINAVRREFGLDKDYKIKPLTTTYNPQTQKYDYERGFPDFCKTPEYDEYLNEMEGNKKE